MSDIGSGTKNGSLNGILHYVHHEQGKVIDVLPSRWVNLLQVILKSLVK